MEKLTQEENEWFKKELCESFAAFNARHDAWWKAFCRVFAKVKEGRRPPLPEDWRIKPEDAAEEQRRALEEDRVCKTNALLRRLKAGGL